MDRIYYSMTEKNKLKEDLLYIPKKFKKYLKCDNIIWIYKIINLKDERVYIGKTNDINRRALNYVNEYLKGDISRKLSKAFQELGLSNFLMSPLEIATNEKSAEIKEKYYIDLFDSIEKGFNVINNSAPTYTNRRRPSVHQTLYSKMIKSKLIAAINTDKTEIIFSTGLKLFGDFIGRSKDEVKSAAKRETRLEGYFIYYMNFTDFSKQILDAESKINKNTTYEDYKLQYYDFIKYSNYLISILKDLNKNTEEFEIKFITQSNDKCGYKFEDINNFFEYYKNAVSSIVT